MNQNWAERRIVTAFLKKLEAISTGRLTLVTPEKHTHVFGDATRREAPDARLEIHDWAVIALIVRRGDIGFGEAYSAGMWDSPDIDMLVRLALLNDHVFADNRAGNVLNRLRFLIIDRVLRSNSPRRASKNIRAHYDVGNEFYRLWLDETMTYSSAIFAGKDADLKTGQITKYDRLLNAIQGGARQGERVLEIGCGWGGFIEQATTRDHHVTGLTISPAQKAIADTRTQGKSEVRLQDYRDVRGEFDSIVSIEMIEAVGEKYWPVYFQTLYDRLAKGGRAAIQAILVPDSEFDRYRLKSDYIRHYTFPGGMLPSLAKIKAHARAAGLDYVDAHHFGADYTATLNTWRDSFLAARPEILKLGYDQAFIRSWLYYFGICAGSFATKGADVAQIVLQKG